MLPKTKMLPKMKMALLLPPKMNMNRLSRIRILSVFIFYKHSILNKKSRKFKFKFEFEFKFPAFL